MSSRTNQMTYQSCVPTAPRTKFKYFLPLLQLHQVQHAKNERRLRNRGCNVSVIVAGKNERTICIECTQMFAQIVCTNLLPIFATRHAVSGQESVPRHLQIRVLSSLTNRIVAVCESNPVKELSLMFFSGVQWASLGLFFATISRAYAP